MHKPIKFYNLTFSCSHKTCFADFSGQIPSGSRIAIIGANGSGKSSLLKILAGLLEPSEGEIELSTNLKLSLIPQLIENNTELSGGQRFNKELSKVIAENPELLMLDEPSNHLDLHNRISLKKMLTYFAGTLIMVTHDSELLDSIPDIIWHVEKERVNVFHGSYQSYIQERQRKQDSIGAEMKTLLKQKKELHLSLMKEEARAKNSRLRGEKHIKNKKWPTIVSATKTKHGVLTAGQNKKALNQKKEFLLESLDSYKEVETVKAKFTILGEKTNQTCIAISEASIYYKPHQPILQKLSLVLKSGERIAIKGRNGSGKSTLIKAILNDESVFKEGNWQLIKRGDIGYLSQHYETLEPQKTVYEIISPLLKDYSYMDIRKYLNDFLFRKNEEVNALVAQLSGGEKARLSLAKMTAINPKLIILDEMTNNIDMETRQHVIEVLKGYPGALIAISHDEAFLEAIHINQAYEIRQNTLNLQ